MTTFINLTPHTLNIQGIGELPPSGVVARLSHERTMCDALEGPQGPVRVIQQDFGPVANIPPEAPGKVYIVSALIISAILARDSTHGDPLADRIGRDIFAPDTGPDAVRERGQVVAVRGLVW